ncbi:MAG: threonine ammonia-lyase [Chromatiales bacterium]|nr:threonine ammonia-lyase [Chromatiales bacterium]
MNEPVIVTSEEVAAARARIRGGVQETPCPYSPALSDLTGAQVFCKLDNLQHTGSFKERGARNSLSRLDAGARERGVVAASAGNHALGLAYHGRALGIPVTVVMPRFAPLMKVSTCRRFGADVVLHGDSFAEARAEADRLAEARGLRYVNGYDDPDIIAGQGSIALEVLEQVADLDAIIVPVGGGGLVAGVVAALKGQTRPVRVIGVEPVNVASFHAAMAAGRPVAVAASPTLADGLAVAEVGANAFATARDGIERLVQVDEAQIARAILRILEIEKTVVEGAAATTLAALTDAGIDDLQGRRVALLFCGGNIDSTVLSRIIAKGLAADGRLCRFTAHISDRPGGLAKLAGVIAGTGAAILDVFHDRAFSGPDVTAVAVMVTVETRDEGHITEMLAALDAAGIDCRRVL